VEDDEAMPTELVRRDVAVAREEAVKELSNSEFAMKNAQRVAGEAATALRDAQERHRVALSSENAIRLQREALEAHLTASTDRPALLERRLELLSKQIEELSAATRAAKGAVDKAQHLFDEHDRTRAMAEEIYRRIQGDLRDLDEHIRHHLN